MRRAAIAYCALAALLFVPWLTEEREVVESTPAHPPLYQRAVIAVEPRSEVCVEPVTIPAEADMLRFGILGETPREPFVVTARARGYAASARPAGYANPLAVDVPIEPPGRDVRGSVCFRNDGRRPVALLATTDARILSRADPVVDGKRVSDTEVALTVMRREPASLASRVDEVFAHASNLAPGFAGPWLFWLLSGLVLVAIPLGALAAAAKPEDGEQERREEDL